MSTLNNEKPDASRPITEDEERVLFQARYWRRVEKDAAKAVTPKEQEVAQERRKRAAKKLRGAIDYLERRSRAPP